MAGGVISGFVCGATVGAVALVAWSQMTPLPPGPAPLVPVEGPLHAPMPDLGAAPALPEPQAAP